MFYVEREPGIEQRSGGVLCENGAVLRSGANEKDPIKIRISVFHVERFSEAALSVYFASPHQEESLQRTGNRDWILPQPSVYLLDCV